MKRIVMFMLCFTIFMKGYAYSEKQNEERKDIAATVNGVVITYADLQKEINNILPFTTYHRKMPAYRRKEIIGSAMDNLIMAEVKYQKAKQLGLKVDKKKINRELKNIRNRFASKQEFKKALKASNMTIDDFKKNVIEKRLLINMITKQGENIEVNVTEQTLRDYYNKNKKRFVMPEQRRIRQILLKVDPGSSTKQWNDTKKIAEQVLAQIKAGEDFAELAREFSDDPSNVNGGDVGFVHHGQLANEVNEEVFKNLKVGEISNVITSLYGHHIVKLEEIKKRKQLEFDELNKSYLMKELEKKVEKEKREAWLKDLKKDIDIKIFVEEIKQ